MKLKLILLFLLLFAISSADCCFFAEAQEVRSYTSDDRLSSGLVNKIVQDSRGYIWITTENGLNLFDGTRFKTYYVGDGPRSLSSNYVRTIHESDDGRIRVGCINGLLEYDYATDTFSPIPMYAHGKLQKPHVYDICQLSSGEIWIATAGAGVFRYDPERNEATSIDTLNSLIGSKFISLLYEDSMHVVWIGTEKNGVCRYFPSSGKARNFRMPELAGNVVQAVTEDDKGNILLGTLDGGIEKYDRKSERFEALPSDVPDTRKVTSMTRVGEKILAGTDGNGVLVIENGRVSSNLEIPSAPESGKHLKVMPILNDRDGNLWLGVFQQGVICLPRRRFKFNYFGKLQYAGNPIGENCVTAVYADRDNTLWVSCDTEGVYHIDREGRRLGVISPGGAVMCMLRDSKGVMWAGAYQSGAFRMDAGGNWQTVPELADRKIYSLAENPYGGLFVGSLDRGLELFDSATGNVYDCLDSESCRTTQDAANVINCVNYLMMSRRRLLWIAHYNGVSCYDPVSRHFVRHKGGVNILRNVVAYSLMEDKNGDIWAGTLSGLYHYYVKTGEVKHYSTSEGLPNNVVSGICEDDSGKIWISTYHGVACLNPDTDKMTLFDAGDGLQGNEFTHGAFCSDDRGNIYFGGSRGVTVFHPHDVENADDRYVPMITEVGVYRTSEHGKEDAYEVVAANCSRNAKVVLGCNENTIRIFFSTLTYDNPRKIRFEYRIVGWSDKWIATEPGQGMVTFYNLAPGTYDFEIRVQTNPGEVCKLKIVVSPPWFLSWPAKTVYAILFVLLATFLVYAYRRHLKSRRDRARQIQAQEMAEAKLQLFTDFSHKLRTPMTLIMDPMRRLIAKADDDSSRQTYTLIYNNAGKVMELVNNLVDNPDFQSARDDGPAPLPVMDIDWSRVDDDRSERDNRCVVIVEGDDEVREYFLHVLENHYRNVKAFADAEEAFANMLTMNPMPDIVISAVILKGEMDGVAFTRKLKQNAQLNHVPVILLSAKSEADNVKQAIESGADNCIVKPVSSELLVSTVHTVLDNRHLLKVKFSGNQEQEGKIENIEIKSADELLMKRVMESVNKNLGSSEFSVEALAEDVGISRAHLHRKLKELTNLSARDFIRSIRMKQAARLLTENHLSVSEVAYATGFANPSHFSTVFKEYFGKTPTQYVRSCEVGSEIAAQN